MNKNKQEKIKTYGTHPNYEAEIYSDDRFQGGRFCLMESRITVSTILESIKNGYSLEQIVKNLKKMFKYKTTVGRLESALMQYQTQINLIGINP